MFTDSVIPYYIIGNLLLFLEGLILSKLIMYYLTDDVINMLTFSPEFYVLCFKNLMMLYSLDLKQQIDYWVKLWTLSTIQPYAYVQVIRDMQLHLRPTEWVMDLPPWETRIPA